MGLLGNQNQEEVRRSDNSLSDGELVKLSLQNADNFGQIVERYEKKLLRYIIYFTGVNRQLAEDILQDTMINVYKNLNSFNPKLKFSSWIYRIAHNQALNAIRAEKNKGAVSLDAEDDESVSLIKVLASEENLVAKVEQQVTAEKVSEIMNLMRQDYRELLVLRFLDDYDYSEICDILRKPMGTVGVMIARAKDEFKNLAIKYNLLGHE